MSLFLWLTLWPLVMAAAVFPIRFGSLRLFLIAGSITLWAGCLYLFWNQKSVRLASIIPALVLTAFLLLPGRVADTSSLRREYVRSLLGYQGTRYVWGGENKLGIDCSGLPRCALMNANLRQGVLTANPRLLRESLTLWWFDSSAKALKEGYRDKTRVLLTSRSINALDHSRILPGDFAVTSSGVHALCYLGDKTWIEADPGPQDRVITLKVPTANAWFNIPVHIMRWRQFEARR
ncbi:MAG TPA: NlpC/P60 family protein [Abditibacteriaceae bacterium]|nr:NlpC/P60 family protein [Abditibacteriaceae bacterium]